MIIRKGKARKSANSRRGTANSRYLRSSSRALRPSGPYRPRRPPRPSKDTSLRNFWILIFFLALSFCLGQIWKSHQISILCADLDSLRHHQQNLEGELLSLQMKYEEISKYSHIEKLAGEILDMYPSQQPPIVIVPLDEQFLAFRKKSH